jgi:hypothetical protein
VPLTIRDGDRTTRVDATTVWLVQPSGEPERHWTRSANPLAIRTLPDNADPRTLLAQGVARVEGAMLLADLPETSTAATITVGNVEIEPLWLEPGPAPSVDPERGAVWRDDRPDPVSPFEWFRWTLLADERGEAAPSPPGDAATQLMARHVADLWRAGLARVGRMSRGVHLTLRWWLTATCKDGDAPGAPEIGAWIADAGELSSLLALLLDHSREDDVIMRSALAWTDARTPLTMWVDADVQGQVVFSIANPLEREVVVRMQWFGEQLPPLATLIPPRSVMRSRVDRPHSSALRGANSFESAPEPLVLAVEAELFRKRLSVAPSAVVARPPATSFGAFVAPFSLADAQSGRGVPVDPAWATLASLRRRGDTWEIFGECFAGEAAGDDVLRLRIGSRELVVHRDGGVDGDGAGATGLDVVVRPFEDRWRVRVALPSAWLPPPTDEGLVMRLAMRRETGARRATAVLAVPARAGESDAIPIVEVDLAAWSGSR